MLDIYDDGLESYEWPWDVEVAWWKETGGCFARRVQIAKEDLFGRFQDYLWF